MTDCKRLPYGALVLAVLALALLLRLHGIDWGLPNAAHPEYSYHPDEPYTFIWAQWLVEGRIVPKQFIYGGTLFYTVLNAYSFIGGLLAGVLEGFNQLSNSILLGRYVQVCVALITLLLVIESGRLLFDRATGLIAALLIAVMPAHVIYAQIVRPDEIGVMMVSLSVYLSARILNADRVSQYRAAIYIAVMTGIMLSFRFPLAVFSIMPTVALLFRMRGDPSRLDLAQQLLKLIPFIGAVVVVTYIVLSPHSVIYFNKAIEGLSITYKYESTIFLDSFENGPLAYQQFRIALPEAFGPGVFFLSLIGLVYALWKRSQVDIVILSGVGLYMLLLVNATWVVARYSLPLAPLLALLAGHVTSAVYEAAGKRWQRSFAVILVTAMVVWTTAATVALLNAEASKNVREVAAQWIEQNVEPGARILMGESYFGDDSANPELSDRFRVQYIILEEKNDSASIIRNHRFDYVVLNETIYRNMERLGDRYPMPQSRAFYQTLNATGYAVWKELSIPIQLAGMDFSRYFTVNDYALINPHIRIYRRAR